MLLHLACQMGSTHGVRLLLALGADVNERNNSGLCPISIACRHGHVDIVKLLLSNENIKLDHNLKYSNGLPQLSNPFCLACKAGHLDIVKVLLDDPRINIDEIGFDVAVQLGHLDIVETLLAHPRLHIVDTDPLWTACTSNNASPKMVEALLRSDRSDITLDGKIHEVCENGRLDIVKVLLADKRCDINQLNEEGKTPLYCALEKMDHLSYVIVVSKDLISKKANDCLSTVNELLKDPRVDVNKSCPLLGLLEQVSKLDKRKNETLTIDASEQIQILETLAFNLFKILITHKHINLNQTNGWTPFFYTCLHGLTEYMELLLKDPRVEVNQPDTTGETPFGIACHIPSHRNIKILLANERIDVNKLSNGQTPLSYCCEKGYLDRVEILLESPRIDIYISDKQGRTPFLLATLNNHFEIVEKLVKHALYHEPSLLQLPTEALIFLFYDLENFPIWSSIRLQWNKVRSCVPIAKNETKETMSAEYAALMIFYRDGYLQYKKNTPIDTQRFFKITAQLPEEIEGKIALQFYPSTKEIIAPKKLSAALIKTSKSYKN